MNVTQVYTPTNTVGILLALCPLPQVQAYESQFSHLTKENRHRKVVSRPM